MENNGFLGEKKAFFDENSGFLHQNSEKLSTKIVVSHIPYNPDYEFSVQIKDLEKRVLLFAFIGFIVAVASVVI